ncbi:hypothetical protein R1sor_009263 [Riccia sorocarpa]|uniref:WD repeat-containing protein 75 second beta-propeller domain-containing protein n=1 Tax=Riccia sorocarpa TaxID=122646 RepID=A0ABD3HY51_9MARC
MVIRGGGSLVRYQPAFSNDGKLLLVCKSALVTVYSTDTSLPVRHLSGHKDAVTVVIVVPPHITKDVSVNRCYTASMDGTVRFWNFSTDGPALKVYKVGHPIEYMVMPSLLRPLKENDVKTEEEEKTEEKGKNEELIAYVSIYYLIEGQQVRAEAVDGTKATDVFGGRVKVFDLRSQRFLNGTLVKTTTPQPLAVSSAGSFVGMTWSRKVYVWRVPPTHTDHVKCITLTTLNHTKVCKVVTFDPSERVVSAGDHTGRILCWQSVGERRLDQIPKVKGGNPVQRGPKHNASGVRGNDDAASCTTYHWHSNAVRALCFSVDGTYLFSGGSEGTLVIWQPETGKQQYRPRLGGPLVYITQSPDPALFAISCLDNTIKFINLGTSQVEKVFQGIKTFTPLPASLEWISNTRVILEPGEEKLAFPTDNMGLQFYDGVRDWHTAEVQIAPRTYVGVDFKNDETECGPSTFVTHVAFSCDGSTMATVDICLPEEEIGGTASLKIWDRHASLLKYTLSTIVNDPHGADITSLVYHPTKNLFVTCSLDATFKIWVQSSDFSAEGETATGWMCRSLGSYRRKQILAAAFSPDGTVLAVAAEELVTLWNPFTNGFLTSLVALPFPQKIKHLAFVHETKYLVATSTGKKPRMTVWHLPSLSIRWSSPVYVEALAVDPRNPVFAVIALTGRPTSETTEEGYENPVNRKSVVAVFDPEDPTPISAWSLKEGIGGSLLFSSTDLNQDREEGDLSDETAGKRNSCLVVVTGSREYVMLNPFDKKKEGELSKPKAKGSEAGARRSGRAKKVAEKAENRASVYQALYGNAAAPRVREASDVVGMLAPKPWGDLLNAPSHVLPPLTKISYAFLESLLKRREDTDETGMRPEP